MLNKLTSIFRFSSTTCAEKAKVPRTRQLASRFFASFYNTTPEVQYDPYQTEAIVLANRWNESCDNGCSQEPAKKRVRSSAENVVQRVLNKAYMAYEHFWTEKEFLPKSTSLFTTTPAKPKMRGRGVDFSLYDNDDYSSNTMSQSICHPAKTNQQCRIRINLFSDSMDLDSEPVLVDSPDISEDLVLIESPKHSIHATDDDNNKVTPAKRSSDEAWGLIDKENYEVEFLKVAPPKPKRTYKHQVNSLPGRNRISTPYDHYRNPQCKLW